MAESTPAAQQLDKERHLRYWQRCWKTFLPTQYTSHDSTRMTIAFFIVAAFDLLSPSSASGKDQHLTGGDRARIRTWVLSLQHPQGGFCGSPSHALPDELCRGVSGATLEAKPRNVGAANLAATFFALLLLALAADDTEDGQKSAFDGVNRLGTLRWLRRLQRPDGSFGEVLLDDGNIAGGRDMRYCQLAAMVRWCLRGNCQVGDGAWTEDINVEALIQHIRQGQSYDGGVAESSQHESHAGYAYCAVGALSLLHRHSQDTGAQDTEAPCRTIADTPSLIKSLAFRQFAYLETDPEGSEEDDADSANFKLPESLQALSLQENMQFVGFNGRCNKVADTCYCWWVAGTLSMLTPEDLIATLPSRNFLFSKTQHLIGGFSKHPGGPPDIYHAYLGLAALATMGDTTLKELDASLCVSAETAQKIGFARAKLLETDQFRGEWAHQSKATSDFWTGKEAAWPKTGVSDEALSRLAEALETLA